jgi:hypothetical protein
MVTYISTHAASACGLRFFASSAATFSGIKKHTQISNSCIANRIGRNMPGLRACNLLTSTLISIDAFEKNGVAFEY